MEKQKQISRSRRLNLAAVLFGLLLLGYFCVTARYAVSFADESSLYAVPFRFLLGDSPVTDEWHLSQISYLQNVPLLYLYTALTGGTEGVTLFFRICFALSDTALFGYLFFKLRRFGAAGLAAAFLFCALIPYVMLAYSYITYSVHFLMIVCMLLMIDEKRKRAGTLIAAGIFLALGIMSEPFLIFLYAAWAVCAVIYALRKKKNPETEYGFLLDLRVVLFVTAGCLLVLAALIAVLFAAGSFRDLQSALPHLFTGREYNAVSLLNLEGLRSALSFFGKPWIIGLCLCIPASAAVRFLRKNRPAATIAVLFSACGFLAACYIHAGLRLFSAESISVFERFFHTHNAPLLLFAPVPFLLSAEKPEKGLVCMLITGEAFSLLVDLSSRVMIGSGGFLVRVPVILQTAALLRELSAARKQNENETKPRRPERMAARVCAGLCAVICLSWNLPYIWFEGGCKFPDRYDTAEPLSHTLTYGPMKNLKTTDAVAGRYEATLADMDRILSQTDGAVAVLDAAPYLYLYAKRPCACFSVWYKREWDRLLDYWRLDYTNKPSYIYIPLYSNGLFQHRGRQISDQLSDVRAAFDCDIVQGEAGYIVKINAFRF